jgi:hypothetical protein
MGRNKPCRDADVRAKLPPSAANALKEYEARRQVLTESIEGLHKHLDSINDVQLQKEFDFYLHSLEERPA